MNTGEFAKLCGVEKRTLFHYDEIGLLKPARVRENGYREYTMEQLGLMDMIKIFQACGYSLAEIRDMRSDTPDAACGRMKTAMERISGRIWQLEQMKSYLQSKQNLLEEYHAFPEGTCQIREISLRYERKMADPDSHFFSFLRDGTFSISFLEENGGIYVCRPSAAGPWIRSGRAISFFIQLSSETEHLKQTIEQELARFRFSAEKNYFIESLPHFLFQDQGSAVLKITAFEDAASEDPGFSGKNSLQTSSVPL